MTPKKKKIGRYQIERELESSLGSTSYLAFDRESGRNVNLERIPDMVAGEPDAQARKANQLKARQAARLRHSRIAQAYEVVEEGGGLWVAREPVKGESLENLLCTDAAISKELVSHILYQTAECLDYAHKLGVYHGVLTPAELIVQENSTVKVLGFWKPFLASRGDVSAFERTHYASPEQIRGLPADAASDQYSLATVAYELLAGATPFQGDAIAVRNRIVLDAPPEPSSFNPTVGPDVSEVLLRALKKVPGERFPSCSKFVAALDQALEMPPAWVLPEEYQGHGPTSPSQADLRGLEGDVTEALLKKVLSDEQAVEESPPTVVSVSKYAKPIGIAIAAALLIALLFWGVNSVQEGARAAAGLTVPPASPPPVVVNQPYEFTLEAEGGEAPYEWSVVEGSLPEGISLQPGGMLQGQSGVPGVYEVRVQVKEKGSPESAVDQQLSLTVKEEGPRIKSEETLEPAFVGQDYSYPIGVEGGQRPYRWSVTNGSIPPGMSLNTFSGYVGGRPQTPGTYRFSVSVSDLFGATASRSFELVVQPAEKSGAAQRVALSARVLPKMGSAACKPGEVVCG